MKELGNGIGMKIIKIPLFYREQKAIVILVLLSVCVRVCVCVRLSIQVLLLLVKF